MDGKMKRCLNLFGTFFKIGLFTFGGGYAMLSLIEHEAVEKQKWISGEDLMDIFAIAESTPGPVAINTATYVGYKQAGVAGSASATLGVVMPSFIIIYIISLFIEQFMALTIVQNAFMGIQVAVGFLILRAGLRLMKKVPKDIFSRILCGGALIAMLLINIFAWDFSTIWLILIGAVCGIMAMTIRKAGGAK